MKLVKQTTLSFQEGRSDKVYEVDLCEVGNGLYVVNFRYGRRGASLKEGSKTAKAVKLTEAEKIFASLVTEKTRKGYREPGGQSAAVRPSSKTQLSIVADSEARKQSILKRFADEKPSNIFKKKEIWSLDRAIWRAGELKIKEAVPYLINFIGTGKALRDYCISWSLGFCGDEQAIPALRKLYQTPKTPDMVRRIACEALLKLSDAETRNAFREDLINSLPQELSYLARRGSAAAFATALSEYLDTEDHTRFEVLEKLYLIDSDTVRLALLDLLRTAPLRPNYFQRIRHIFKAAEYRRDAEVFGIIAYRFEKSRAMFSSSRWGSGLDEDSRYPTWVHLGGENITSNYIQDGRKEIQSPTSKIGYGSRTRGYLRSRVWRTLRRLGEVGDLDYVKMAVGVLLPFSDADAQAVKESFYFDQRARDFVKSYWDAFAPYWAFNQLLYQNSPRYMLRGNSKTWRCKPRYKPGDPAPQVREEAFPRLWEQKPEGLVHLIAESNCRPVVEFAARALGTLDEFCAQLDEDTVLMILERPYEEAARLGFKLAQARYNTLSPNRTLTMALANCALEDARKMAHAWVNNARESFLKDGDFLTAVVFSPYADTREFARNLLRSSASSEASAKALATKFLARLTAMGASETDVARDVVETILKCFAPQLRTIDLSAINLLLSHPLLEAQELGGQLLLNHNTPAKDLPDAVISSLIASPFESLRGIGIKLFGQLEDATLLEREGVIVSFATHELEDIRNAIRPVIRRLCNPPTTLGNDRLTPEQCRDFSLKLAAQFLMSLTEKERYEGVHSSLVKIMREDVGTDWMKQATQGMAWKLAQSKSQAAQELGGVLMNFKADDNASFADDFDFTELVELSGHEVRAIREASWTIFSKLLRRLRVATNPDNHHLEMAKAVKLLDAKWDDSRDHWFQVFDESFTAKDFTPGILVSVCDSVKPEVQMFGRRLITRFFAEEDGQEYLLKLSEHPSVDLQTFATNYLERYAADNPSRLADLTFYFISVLSRVNRARVAKSRLMAFLTAEAQKSEAAARIVAAILTRQSVTVAIGDKASAIEALLQIRQTFPQVVLPIEVRQPEVRHAF